MGEVTEGAEDTQMPVVDITSAEPEREQLAGAIHEARPVLLRLS